MAGDDGNRGREKERGSMLSGLFSKAKEKMVGYWSVRRSKMGERAAVALWEKKISVGGGGLVWVNGSLPKKKGLGLGFVVFLMILKITPHLLCKCWKPVFIGKKCCQVFQLGPSTSFFFCKF